MVRGQLVLHSDQPLPQHHQLLEELAAQRDELLSLVNLPPSEQPVNLYLFDSSQRFKEFMQSRYPDLPDRRAFFVESDTRLAIYAYWGDRVAEDLRHEVAHGYLHSVAPKIPLWLDEGLAENFEVPRGLQRLNWPHVEHLASRLQEGWRPNLRRLESMTSPAEMDQIDYAESWAWVHFLSCPQRLELMRRYMNEIRNGGAAEPISAPLFRELQSPNETLADYVRQLASQRKTANTASHLD